MRLFIKRILKDKKTKEYVKPLKSKYTYSDPDEELRMKRSINRNRRK